MAVVPARTGLAGHPSDAFEGAVLAVPIPELFATVSCVVSDRVAIGDTVYDSLDHLAADASLLAAAAAATVGWAHANGGTPTGFTLRWSTSIPESCGLAGSSALVIGVIRSLAALWGLEVSGAAGPRLALEVETQRLGIAAGPQDRIVQWHGSPLLMDFADGVWTWRRVRPARPIEVFVCWTSAGRTTSGTVHAPLQSRRDDPDLRAHMTALGSLAHAGARALAAGDLVGLRRCLDEGFEHRRALVPLDPAHVALVEGARACGAACTYTGSGGAIAALADDLAPLRAWADRAGLGHVTTTVA